MIDVNVGPALWLTQAVAPYLRDRGSGSIVHVAARPGLRRPPGWPPTASARRRWSTSPACSTWRCARSGSGSTPSRRSCSTPPNRPYLTPDLLAHAVTSEAVADIIVYLVSDAAAPISGAIVPAYGP